MPGPRDCVLLLLALVLLYVRLVAFFYRHRLHAPIVLPVERTPCPAQLTLTWSGLTPEQVK